MTTAMPTLVEDNLEVLAQRVDTAMSEVQKLDDGDRAKALDLQRAVEGFHKVGITKIVQHLKADERGKQLLFELVDVPEVYALFAMHGIVRADLTTQVMRVIDMVKPYMRSHGGDVEFDHIEGDTVFVKLHGACNGCSMSSVTLRNGVEEALREHVPQIKNVEVVPNDPGAGMIMLDTIGMANGTTSPGSGWVQGPAIADVPENTPTCFDADQVSVLLLNIDNQFFAYRNECSHMGMPLDGGMFDAESCILTCPWHGFRFDITSGECMTAPQAQLEPFPLRVEDGVVWVRPN